MNLVLAMRRGAWAAMAAGLIAAGGSGEAALISNSTVIPDSEVLIDFSGTGLDWVYAGAVQPGVSGFGMEAPSYRASEGWRFATASEWALRPAWNDFIKPGNEGSGPSGYGYSHVA